jgi:hypothetical protein
VGNKGRLPDFVVLYPGRGLLVLEVKGWRAGALHQVSRHDVELNLGERAGPGEQDPPRPAGAIKVRCGIPAGANAMTECNV